MCVCTGMCQGRLRLDSRKNFFFERVVKYWNEWPEEVTNLPSLEGLEKQQEISPGAVGWLRGGDLPKVGFGDLRGLFQA